MKTKSTTVSRMLAKARADANNIHGGYAGSRVPPFFSGVMSNAGGGKIRKGKGRYSERCDSGPKPRLSIGKLTVLPASLH